MEIYERRLDSFNDPRWPYSLQALIPKLASAGFYFKPTKKSQDNVCCYQCKREIDGWKPDVSPWQVHADLLDKTGKGLCPLTSLEIEKNRLATFSRWPKEKLRFQANPTTLASAGFYLYPTLDSADLTRCYQCHVALDSWDKDDDPLQEHRKRNPACPHLQNKAKPPYEYRKVFEQGPDESVDGNSSQESLHPKAEADPDPLDAYRSLFRKMTVGEYMDWIVNQHMTMFESDMAASIEKVSTAWLDLAKTIPER